MPDGDVSSIDTLQPIWVAMGICPVGTLVLGILAGIVPQFADLGDLTGAFGRWRRPGPRVCAQHVLTRNVDERPRMTTVGGRIGVIRSRTAS